MSPTPPYVSTLVSVIANIMMGTGFMSQFSGVLPGGLWPYLCKNVTVSIGGATSTLDPLQFGTAATQSGSFEDGCHSLSWYEGGFAVGGSASAGLNVLSGLSGAQISASTATVSVSCTPSNVVTVVFPVTVPNLTALGFYNFSVGSYIIPWGPCINSGNSENISTSATALLQLTVPFTMTATSVSYQLNQCSISMSGIGNMSFVSQIENIVHDILDGLTLGIAAIPEVWNALFQPLFDELNAIIYDAIDDYGLSEIPSDVLANEINGLPALAQLLVQMLTNLPFGAFPPLCCPECTGKECGADGCGGTCGQCSTNQVCDAAGQCLCSPQCEGKTCGADGCGGTCGACGPGYICLAQGVCGCSSVCGSFTNSQGNTVCCGTDGQHWCDEATKTCVDSLQPVNYSYACNSPQSGGDLWPCGPCEIDSDCANNGYCCKYNTYTGECGGPHNTAQCFGSREQCSSCASNW